MSNWLSVLSILTGFIGLIWSADKFVLGASTTARNLGVSPLMIGLTIVAFGTSAPEIFTSAAASLKGAPELAIGNAIGSNIANIGLVLGVTLIVSPIVIPVSLLKQELPALLIVSLAVFFILQDLLLNWIDGGILLLLLSLLAWRIMMNKRQVTSSNLAAEEKEAVSEFIADISTSKALALMLFGLILMIISSNILVNGATKIALALGVSELVIGLTIIAIGTSLPELAASVTSVLKGHHDLAIGNVVGSNILNLLMVLPVPAFLAPVAIEPLVVWRDYAAMLILTVTLALLIFFLVKQKRKIGRKVGSVLLLMYLSYTGLLLLTQ